MMAIRQWAPRPLWAVASETVTLYWNCSASPCTGDTVLASTTTTATGTFTNLAATVPSTATPAKYLIGGVGATSGDFADKSFTVMASKASLTVSPDKGKPGSAATVSGANFKASETVTIYWNCATSACTSTTVLGTVTTSATGSFSNLVVTIPTATVGSTYAVGAKGSTSGAFAAIDVKILA